MNLGCFLVPLILISSVAWCAADEDAEVWTTFGKGEDQKRFSNCFIISYPHSFSVDPASGITPSLSFGVLPIPEENLHSLILHNGNKSLEVRASSYSFLDEEFYTSHGFASPREVILTDFFQNSMTMKISHMEDFDLFYSETDCKVVALFLDRDAKWGSCYQSLTFLFRNDTTFKDHAKVVEKIIAKFIPSFARSK
jgi:hypothetical protein